MNEAELMYECQACYKAYGESKLITVKGIEYSHWHRVFPWLICMQCAEKISDALLVKVVEEVGGVKIEGKNG